MRLVGVCQLAGQFSSTLPPASVRTPPFSPQRATCFKHVLSGENAEPDTIAQVPAWVLWTPQPLAYVSRHRPEWWCQPAFPAPASAPISLREGPTGSQQKPPVLRILRKSQLHLLPLLRRPASSPFQLSSHHRGAPFTQVAFKSQRWRRALLPSASDSFSYLFLFTFKIRLKKDGLSVHWDHSPRLGGKQGSSQDAALFPPETITKFAPTHPRSQRQRPF